MTSYRCPYCKEIVSSPPPSKCPFCARHMCTPAMKEISVHARKKKTIERIWRTTEKQKQALHALPSGAPWRGPLFYGVVLMVLIALGVAMTKAAQGVRTNKNPRVLRAQRNLDALATACGRYYFHTRAWPTDAQGLAALATRVDVVGWDGPYIRRLTVDPWGNPYGYALGTNALPRVWSLGEDGLADTADDLSATPGAFNPGTDWTNGWVSAEERYPRIIR